MATIRECKNKPTLVPGLLHFTGAEGCSTSRRAKRTPALIRLARRSQSRKATSAPATFSRSREKGLQRDEKQTHQEAIGPRKKSKAIEEIRRTDGENAAGSLGDFAASRVPFRAKSYIEAYSALNSRAARGSSSGLVPIWFIV